MSIVYIIGNNWLSVPAIDGDVLISFTSADKKNSWGNTVHYFNFYELLNDISNPRISS
jgi:hypothetical protein